MGRSLNQTSQNLITVLLAEGRSIQDIIDEVKCSRRTVLYYKRNIQLYGQALAPKIVRQGRPQSLTVEMVNVYSFHPQLACLNIAH
jgi:transposase